MNEFTEQCVVCGGAIPPGAPAFDIRTFLDPMPPKGLACSKQCAQRAESESKMRTYLTIDAIKKGFGG
jgi:predicted nucleic acid-binding Zn ribbon protein